MSYDESHIGRLILLTTDAEDTAKELCEEENIVKEERKTYVETAEKNHLGYPDYFIKNGQIWKIEELYSSIDDPYIFYHKSNNNGTIDFVFSFYNGGTCLYDCLENIFKDKK